MAHVKQTNRRRSSSSLCHRHQSPVPTSGFCASCLRERLATIEAMSSSIRTPELRRIRSHSVRDPSTAFISEQPRRRSCDVRSSASSLHDLFVDDDEIESGEHKTMKEFIDLDWRDQIKKNNGKDMASVLSRKLKNFSLSRHSCDVDPRLSLDGGRISFEKPRASWDGCLLEKTYHKLTPLSTVTEDKSPGGTLQTRDYYSDSRPRRSFDPQGLLDVDELKPISNAKVSPETVGLFHGAKLLVTEKELRDSNWYSRKNHKPESKELGGKGKICIAAREGLQNVEEVKKPKKKWPKGWNFWGLIHKKYETKNEIKTEQSLKLEGNAVEGSLAESLLKLRRVAKGETNGNVSEKLLKSYSVSSRKSCDGVFSGANIVSGRSSCDGLFHGSINSVEVGRSSCDGLVNGIEGKPIHQRKTNDGMHARENLDNSLFRFYLTPARSQKTSKSRKSRLMT